MDSLILSAFAVIAVFAALLAQFYAEVFETLLLLSEGIRFLLLTNQFCQTAVFAGGTFLVGYTCQFLHRAFILPLIGRYQSSLSLRYFFLSPCTP